MTYLSHITGPHCPQPEFSEATKDFSEQYGVDLQFGMNIDEDCLTLDIYSPALSGRYPVMVFIHGGGLVSG